MGWYYAAGAAVLGGIIEGRGRRAQAAYQAHIMAYNAMIERRKAEQLEVGRQWAGIAGGIAKEDFLKEFHKFQGVVRASYSKSMVDPGTGTAQLVQLENAREADQNVAALETQTSAQELAWLERKNQALINAKTLMFERQITLKSGKQKQAAAIAGSLLNAGSIAGEGLWP